MKSYSRKASKTTGSFASAANSTTSAAAFSVTKFGQATFTSVRRKDYENGNSNNQFVPLKQTTLLDDVNTDKKEVEQKATPPSKPKVYKFFKSRGPTGGSEPSENKNSMNNAAPKPIMLNNYSNKDDGVKRITATITKGSTATNYGRNRGDKNASNAAAPKTIQLSDNKQCEIVKVCDDTTIKKVISPHKTTQFIIRNSNVRNATVKPVTTPSNVISVSKGVRASRRLKGIEPEPVSHTKRRSQTIHMVFNKDSPKDNDASKNNTTSTNFDDVFAQASQTTTSNNNENKQFTTLIEEVKDNVEEESVENNEEEEEKMELDDNNGEEKDEEEHEEQPEESNKEQEEEELTNEEEIDKEETGVESEKAVESPNSIENENAKSSPPTPPPTATTTDLVGSQTETSSQQSVYSDTSYPDSQPHKDDEKKDSQSQSQESNKSIPIRPKKKIFSNRDRSKVEFNTKSFFASSTKDEFDMELDSQPTASSSQSSTDKKNGHEFEEDDQYIKLKRVKKAHQCHDLGETEQFDEDIKYYLSGIVSTNPKPMRCLSILGLSQNAMRPEFRMHLRAHDDMPRIIKALMDAPQDPNLALCTAVLMFVYNQADRLTMDIDPNALSLMLELLETRSDECNQVEEKHRTKVVSLVEEMKSKGHAKYLKLNEITAGKLAMETLLGLTSKRAGDWFKTELRKMKGIDFIVNTVLRCAENYSEEGQMVKIDRCMHVLENVTFNNVENQLYITDYNEGKFISTCISLLENCKYKIISSNDSKVFLSAFFSILRVFTNVTSESVDGCKVVGSFPGIMDLLLESVFELPSFILSDQRFDLMVIILCLCINLAEFCENIREIIMTSEKYMARLTEFLFKKIEEAAQVEQQTDQMLESHETVQMTEAMQDNLLMQMISKSGTHMEHSLLSACVCLLFGCCIQENDDFMQTLKDTLPNNSFEPLIEMLEKLRDFAHLADIMTQKGKERVQRVLQIFKMYK